MAQEVKIIEIRKAAGSTQDQEKFPGANILLSDDKEKVNLFHDGGLIISDKAYFYSKRNSGINIRSLKIDLNCWKKSSLNK